MIVEDTSTDVDSLRDDLQFELIVLHGEVKQLNKSWDFSAIVNPLLADQGPPLQVVPRIKKQIERLKKLKEDFEQKARDLQRPAASLAQAAQSFYAAGFPSTQEGKHVTKQRKRQHLPRIDIDEVTPSWGKCKRYSHSIDRSHYNQLVATAGCNDPRTGNHGFHGISGIQSTPSKTGLIDSCLFELKTTLA